MTQIVVPNNVAMQILAATSPIVLVDENGHTLGQFNGPRTESEFSDADIDQVKQRMANDDGTRYTWAEVKQYLQSLAGE